MSGRVLASAGVLATVIAVVSLAPVPVAGQAQTATADAWTPQRTPWRERDLQGIWESPRPTPQGSPIMDPPDGRLPPLTPGARQRAEARSDYRREHPADSWADRSLGERCISAGVPRTFFRNMHILQTPGYVAILYEWIHETRIIPLDGRPHVGPHIRLWKGDSRGRWDGDTLVVETTNFTDKQIFRGFPQGNLHLVERFRRIAPDQIDYRFTLTDPTTWTRPWTVALPLKKKDTEAPFHTWAYLEFACHEGNYGLANILSGARAEEKLPTIELQSVDMDVVHAGAPVPLEADAAAHGGARIERVEFVVDGAVVGVDREAPYEATWTAGGSGRHLVTATAHDSEGHVAVAAPVTVFVGVLAIERAIARSEDDAQEGVQGPIGLTEIHLTTNDLEFIEDRGGDQLVGLRFTDIRIPRGAEIAKAYVQFTAEEVSTDPTHLIIQAELAGNAHFRDVPRNLTSRRRTSASVPWSLVPWEVEGERSMRQRTPDLAALIQEVVDRPDWHEGNALVLLISGSERGERDAWSYDGARWQKRLERAPRLYIERR